MLPKKHVHVSSVAACLSVLLLFSACTAQDTPVSGTPDSVRPSASTSAESLSPSDDTHPVDESISPETTADISADPAAFTAEALEKAETANLRINQVGYRPFDLKRGIVEGTGSQFLIVPAEGGTALFSGSLEDPVLDSVTGRQVHPVDFSAFSIPGRYRLVIDDVGASYPFLIGEDAYQAVDDAVLKFFYYQRCGIELDGAHAGDWQHPACHLEEGKVYGDDSLHRQASGGWHDAGDYGRYVVNTAVSAANLLLAHDLFPDAFSDAVGIPESGNGVPDVLDEVRHALEWMLRMQDPDTGGVYHKLTSTNFPALLLMPQFDLMQLYFSSVSSTATADFAALLAMAARVYAPVDAAFSQACLQASEKAWGWLQAYNGVPGFANPSGMNTGEYGDKEDRDERFWAAAELYRTTGAPAYADVARRLYAEGDLSFTGLDWQEVSGFGSMAWLLSDRADRDPAVTTGLSEKWLSDANRNLRQGSSDTYGSPLLAAEYGWGSNSGVLNRGVRLLVANRLAPNPAFIEAAKECRHYLLGRNVVSQCYLTGFGTKTVRQPHHRPSAADRVKLPVPGMVAGGPNGNLEDPSVKAACEGLPPAACYVDDISSYSTNEIAINWNAPAVFLFAGLNAN